MLLQLIPVVFMAVKRQSTLVDDVYAMSGELKAEIDRLHKY